MANFDVIFSDSLEKHVTSNILTSNNCFIDLGQMPCNMVNKFQELN